MIRNKPNIEIARKIGECKDVVCAIRKIYGVSTNLRAYQTLNIAHKTDAVIKFNKDLKFFTY